MSTPAGSKVARSCTTMSRSPNFTLPPAERSLASATSSPTGKFALGEDRQHRFADGAGGADDGDLECLAHGLMFGTAALWEWRELRALRR